MDTIRHLDGVERVERPQNEGRAPTGANGWGSWSEAPEDTGDGAATASLDVTLRVYQDRAASLIGPLAGAASEVGGDIRNLKTAEVSLEDVFIHFTGRGIR